MTPADGQVSAGVAGAAAGDKPVGEIDVAFGVDANFAVHAAAVIASVVRYGKGGRFRFIVLHTGVTPQTQTRVESVAPGQRFVWVEVSDADLPPFADRGHFTRATLFRMGLEKLAPMDAKKVVYLDADITVMADVRKLAAVDLDGAPVGAVYDPNVDAEAFAAKWNLAGPGAYFNAGILLVDLEKIRAEGLFAKAIAFIAKHDRELPWNDQDALNWALWGRWKKLDAAWNVQRSMAIADAAKMLPADKRIGGKKPAIIHFTGGDKPWVMGAYHPWSHVYWMSLNRTPFVEDRDGEAGLHSQGAAEAAGALAALVAVAGAPALGAGLLSRKLSIPLVSTRAGIRERLGAWHSAIGSSRNTPGISPRVPTFVGRSGARCVAELRDFQRCTVVRRASVSAVLPRVAGRVTRAEIKNVDANSTTDRGRAWALAQRCARRCLQRGLAWRRGSHPVCAQVCMSQDSSVRPFWRLTENLSETACGLGVRSVGERRSAQRSLMRRLSHSGSR